MTPRHQARRIVRLALPAAMQGLVVTALIFTDRLVLGRYAAEALASLNISGTVSWSVLMVGMAWTAGVVAVVGRAVGAGDRQRASDTAGSALALAVVLGAITALALRGALEPIAHAMGPPPETSAAVRGLAVDYMAVLLLGMPFAFAGAAAMASLHAGGDTRTPARAMALAGGLNVLVSVPLVFGLGPMPELGATGAAIGTLSSLVLEAILLVWALRRGRGPVGLGRPRLAALRPVMRVAGPAFAERALYQTGFLVFAAWVGWLGDVAMTAHQTLLAVESLGFIAADAFGVAASALVAQRLGAGDPDDAARAGWWSALVGVGLLSGIGLFFFVAAEPLVRTFTDDPDAVALGVDCLRIAAVAQPLMAAVAALAGGLRGAGDTRTPMVVAIVGPIVIRLAACWLLAFHLELGLIGMWLASTADWAARTVWLAAAFARGRWRSIEV